MRTIVPCFVLAALCGLSILTQQTQAQQNQAAPQTARQALMEMFFSKTPGTLVKHLPEATRAALQKTGALANMQQYGLLMSQMQTQGQNLQTFETGSVLLSAEDPKTNQKTEITVVSDSLRNDQDDIELSFQVYKNGQSQRTPFMPQMTFSMKQEAQVWKLNEISITVHLPLADPDFLKAVTEKMTAPTNATTTFVSPANTTTFTSRSEVPSQPAGSDAMVIASMRTILTAEVTYASQYPMTGFTCTLSDLDGFGGGERSEHQAMLINSGLASGKRYGFVFTLTGCGNARATTFHLTAVPNASTFGRKVFCADQSSVIRSSEDGNPATCLASGTPVQ
jgi:type IV pilus assembly protein PilA